MYEACQSIQVFVGAYVRTHRTFIRIFTGPRSKISKKYIRGPFGPVFRPRILFVGAVAIMTPLLQIGTVTRRCGRYAHFQPNPNTMRALAWSAAKKVAIEL